MRVYLLFVILLATAAASTRRWIVGVGGVIILAALSQHEDMPRSIAGIVGFSPGNLLLGWTLLMFVLQRERDSVSRRGAPKLTMILGLAYVASIAWAYGQGVVDCDSIQGPDASTALATFAGFTIELFVNPLKMLLPAILIYLGLRSGRDYWWILSALGIMALLLAVVTLRNMPLGTLFDEDAFMVRRHRIQDQTGLHANDLALIMVQATWATALFLRLRVRAWRKWIATVCLGLFGLSLALCQSRGGFLAFVVTGLVIGLVCWKRLLVMLPIVMLIVAVAVPTVRTRIMMGIGVADVSGAATDDWETISAGRTTDLWPHAIRQIGEAPLLGSGRLTIHRTELFTWIEEATGELPPTHPHNAYLEMMCDGGVVSLAIFLVCMVCLAILSWSMSRRKESPGLVFVGSLGIVAIVPLMVMGLTGQSFWPRENTLGTACLIGLLLCGRTFQQAGACRARCANLSV